jgi:hypothetical protein
VREVLARGRFDEWKGARVAELHRLDLQRGRRQGHAVDLWYREVLRHALAGYCPTRGLGLDPPLSGGWGA